MVCCSIGVSLHTMFICTLSCIKVLLLPYGNGYMRGSFGTSTILKGGRSELLASFICSKVSNCSLSAATRRSLLGFASLIEERLVVLAAVFASTVKRASNDFCSPIILSELLKSMTQFRDVSGAPEDTLFLSWAPSFSSSCSLGL